MDEQNILKILKHHLGISSLEVQRSDYLDFHKVHINALVRIVNSAFESGKKEGFSKGYDEALKDVENDSVVA